jgi:RNA polymerase sigma-70 factor (ECF subfamily)
VLGSCRLLARNEVRTDRRRRELLRDYGTEHPAANETSRAGEPARLAACISLLTERERTILALTYYAERSGEQIAAELAISHGNVRVVRHRAVAQLLECLSASEEAP